MVEPRRRRNDRLAEAMLHCGVSATDVAEVAGVDPRTAVRWVEDRSRIPRPASRQAVATLLEVPPILLWPSAAPSPQALDDLITLYPTRAAMPSAHLMSLLSGAQHNVDILALAALWLWDSIPDFGPSLAAKAAAGVAVRVCLGDPTGMASTRRGEEEGIADLLAARCRLATIYAQRWLQDSPTCLRLHDTTLYTSILRFDGNVLVNWHLYGLPAAEAPVLHLQIRNGQGIGDACLRSFDRVWSNAHSPPVG